MDIICLSIKFEYRNSHIEIINKSILGSYVNTDDVNIIKAMTQPLLNLTLGEIYTINTLSCCNYQYNYYIEERKIK